MKILLYNWINYDDDERRGGGVRVYQENLIERLRQMPGVRVCTLTSGMAYNPLRRGIYIRERPQDRGVRRYEVVNSPVCAPAHAAFGALHVYLDDTALKAVLQDFLEAQGPFDVIQFDNLEGLTADVFRLKEAFPKTRFVYYMHNYNLICPQVNLWFQETESCDDYYEGRRCAVCLPRSHSMREVKLAHAVSEALKTLHIRPSSPLFRFSYSALGAAKRWLGQARQGLARNVSRGIRLGGSTGSVSPINRIYSSRSIGAVYRRYRQVNVSLMNGHMDRVLAVSRRVKEIAMQHGISEHKLSVLQIATRFSEKAQPIRLLERDGLKIAYLGYERRDKGFYHFMDALQAMPRSTAARISVLIAARLQRPETVARLQMLAVKFADFEIIDGYDHEQLSALLADVDLGIVPVLWEDNLPQVAIEFVSHGVPILSSDLGGAKELSGDNPRFVYPHGRIDGLIDRLECFLADRSLLLGFRDRKIDLMDMRRHVATLMDEVYRGSGDGVTMRDPPWS